MSIQINTDNSIVLDGKQVGLSVRQDRAGTRVYTPHGTQHHPMPRNRYALSVETDRVAFESDLRALLAKAA